MVRQLFIVLLSFALALPGYSRTLESREFQSMLRPLSRHGIDLCAAYTVKQAQLATHIQLLQQAQQHLEHARSRADADEALRNLAFGAAAISTIATFILMTRAHLRTVTSETPVSVFLTALITPGLILTAGYMGLNEALSDSQVAELRQSINADVTAINRSFQKLNELCF